MFFDNLERSELEKIERVGVLKSFKAGECIIREGDSGRSFSIILAGAVEVSKKMPGGHHKVLVDLKEFDVVGELGFFGVKSRSATVTAKTDCEILEFDNIKFEDFVAVRPVVGMKIYKNMAKVLAERLASNDATLMNTIVWALGQPNNLSIDKDINIRLSPDESASG